MQISPSLPLLVVPANSVQPRSAPGSGTPAAAPTGFTQALDRARPMPDPPQTVPSESRSVQPTPAPPRQRRPAAAQGNPPRQLPPDAERQDKRPLKEARTAGGDAADAASTKQRHAAATEKAKPRSSQPLQPVARHMPAEQDPTALIDGAKQTPPSVEGGPVPVRPLASPDCVDCSHQMLPMPAPARLPTEAEVQPKADTPGLSNAELPMPAVGAATPDPAQPRSPAAPQSVGAPRGAGGFERQAMLEAAQVALAARSPVAAAGPTQPRSTATHVDTAAEPPQPSSASAPAVVLAAAAPLAGPPTTASVGPAVSVTPNAWPRPTTHAAPTPSAAPATAAPAVALAASAAPAHPAASFTSTTSAGKGPEVHNDMTVASRPTRAEAAVAQLYRNVPDAAPTAAAAPAAMAQNLPVSNPNVIAAPAVTISAGKRQTPGEPPLTAAPGLPAASPAADPAVVAQPDVPQWREALPPSARPQHLPLPQPMPAPPAAALPSHAEGVVQPVQAPVLSAGSPEVERPMAPALPDSAIAASMPSPAGWSAVGAYQAAQAAVPAEAYVSARPGSADFAPQLGQQITTFVRDGIEHAQLHLNPAEMGPVSVRIQLDGQVAQVHLSADHALTRQALEASMPQLASQLSEAGLTLGGGGVFEQPRQGRDATPQDGAGEPRRQDRAEDARDRGQSQAAPVLPPMRRGVVDLVA